MAVLVKLNTQSDVNQFVSLMHTYKARKAHNGGISCVGTVAIVYPYKDEPVAFAHGRFDQDWFAYDGYVTVNQLATILKGK